MNQHIALLTLNRPESANALSSSLLDELNEHLNRLEAAPNRRVIIITGNGKAFCAGADLKEREGMNDDQVIEAVSYIRNTISRVEKLPMPTIAAINGAAFGGGLELALACDIRIARSTAKLGLTETSLGIIPGAGGTQRLSRLIGIGKAKYFILSAKRITSEEAFQYGIVEEVIQEEDFIEQVLDLANKIAENGPIGVEQAKKAIQEGYHTDLETGLKIEFECYQKTIPTSDRLEGIKAFKEKRKPVYKGK